MNLMKSMTLGIVLVIITVTGYGQEREEIPAHNSELEYIFDKYDSIFPGIKWTTAWMDPDLMDAYDDKNWLGKYSLKIGKTAHGLPCSITLYKSHFLDYENQKPLIKYEDSTGLGF